MQKAAIVILNYNGSAFLRRFLPFVVKYSIYDIIVIDNASTDDSVSFLKNEFPRVIRQVLLKNFGFAEGYNKGLDYLKGRYQYYILLNSDVEVTPSWDEGLIQFLESNPHAAAVQPKILSEKDKKKFDHAGAAGGYLDSLGYPFCRGRILSHLEEDEGQYNQNVNVDWVSGACMAIRADLFHQFRGFDPLFFAHMEEIDLCWRLRNQNHNLYYIYKVSVYHVGGGTLSKSNPFKTYLNFRNSLFTLRKNLNTQVFYKIYCCRIFLDLVAAVVFLFKGLWKDSKSVLNAHIDFHKSKKKLQIPINPSKKVGNTKVKSILWEYYLLGKKKFSEI
ncbi:MAG: glycosyltransferase family 2 protein [Mongoliibacter sp.]|uniref:glycosyltransferase family 2 protein n=1 Tax=Mongoliibacter sp. TaxID=2022438 RepID=UPI0012F1563C|nr:glycosyltransferase family 2 protein [Mongoliibacter sp.]TVP47110.1 MAG: glycosyltransferase family 2 protein [Mongoliibacter sp.]